MADEFPPRGVSNDEQSLASLDAASIVRQLNEGAEDMVVVVGRLDRGQLSHWTDRTTDDVVITSRVWRHMHEAHPDITHLGESIVGTIGNPHLIYRDGRAAYPHSALFVRAISDKHDLIVPVSIARDGQRRNSAVTAHIQRRTRRRNMAKRHIHVWEEWETD